MLARVQAVTRFDTFVSVMKFVVVLFASLISAQFYLKQDGNMSAAVHLDVLQPEKVLSF